MGVQQLKDINTNKMLNFLKKLIPGQIIFRSLYWIQYSEKMDKELIEIFDAIDSGKYSEAKLLIDNFEKKHNQSEAPSWVAEKMAEIHKANSILAFLSVPFQKEPLDILYEEAQQREKILQQEPSSDTVKGRMAELLLITVRIQQLLLEDISHELESRKTTKR